MKAILLSIFLLGSLASYAQIVNESLSGWPTRCKEIQSEFADNSKLDKVFDTPPVLNKTNLDIENWILYPWRKIGIPLMKNNYSKITLTKDSKGHFIGLHLIAENGITINIVKDRDFPNMAYKETFGEAKTSEGLLVSRYSIDRKTFSCDPKTNPRNEMKHATLLYLKAEDGKNPGNLARIYKGINGSRSVTTVVNGVNETGVVFETAFYTNLERMVVTYRFATEEIFQKYSPQLERIGSSVNIFDKGMSPDAKSALTKILGQ